MSGLNGLNRLGGLRGSAPRKGPAPVHFGTGRLSVMAPRMSPTA